METTELMHTENENISSLGYDLEIVDDVERVRPLLDACDLDAFDQELSEAEESKYLVATTPAGGVAASAGWVRYPEGDAIIHSLAVAPSSRGGGLGASMLASMMLQLREKGEVDAIHIGVDRRLVGYFSRLGFVDNDEESLPKPVAEHPLFADSSVRPMVRRYGVERHGLDQSAFCLIHNTTEDATLPVGSVFWFRQSGAVLEAHYRGGPVARGHLLGATEEGALKFVWQSCTRDGQLMRGEGEILINPLDDGRREMRETLGEDPGELLLREF